MMFTSFAAASMANAMAEIEAGFEAATQHDLALSLAGSSVLARQIQQGATGGHLHFRQSRLDGCSWKMVACWNPAPGLTF